MLACRPMQLKCHAPAQVEGSLEAWRCVLEMLYPIYPRPELTFERIATMLRVMHM